MAWDHAVERRKAAVNVVNSVQRPQIKHAKTKVWTDDQLLGFLEHPLVAADRYCAGYWLGAYPGLRVAEVTALVWRQVNAAGNEVQVTHQLRRRDGQYLRGPQLKVDADAEWRVILPEAAEALRAHKERMRAEFAANGVELTDDHLVFVTEAGLPVNGSSWWKHFKLLSRKLGLPEVKLHSLRHKAETTDSRAKTDPATRMLQRGRTSFDSAVGYMHPEIEDQHIAAEEARRVFHARREGRQRRAVAADAGDDSLASAAN